jgi:polysaccharide chain length determinant protein (PEP-CTERM system associated)
MPEQNSDINVILARIKRILVRRCWWILIPACVVSILVIRASYLLPNHYRSEAIIFMAAPHISSEYVVPNDTTNTMEAIDAVTREVLSRARLLSIIDEYGLYPKQRTIGNAALGALMRSDIEVLPLSKNPERKPMNAFLIAFTATDPWTAQKVTNRLASLFIEQNEQAQRQIDTGTTSFLEEQLAAAQSDLDRQEAMLQNFRLRNLGHLPEQQSNNLQVYSGLQFQLQTMQADLARARQQHTYLMAMLSQYAPAAGAQTSNATLPESLAGIEDELARLRQQREDLLSRFSPLYPDVVAIDHRIADEEAKIDAAANGARPATSNKPAETATIQTRFDPASVQLRSQLQANEMEIRDEQKQIEQIQTQISTYQQRLTLTPLLEQQLDELQHSYDLARQHYADLLNKKIQSELATKLAVRQSTEQFQIIDPASFPLKPSGPQRRKIALGALAAGIALGLALAFFVEARDGSFHAESEMRGYFPVPIVIGVPPLLTTGEKRKKTRSLVLSWALSCLMLLLLGAAQFYVYRIG